MRAASMRSHLQQQPRSNSCLHSSISGAARRHLQQQQQQRAALHQCRAAGEGAGDVAWEAVDEPLPAWRRNRLLRNTELLQRLGWTVALALLIRSGCFIPLPDITRTAAPAAAVRGNQLLHSAAELPAALFEVGFAPYFAVSIVMAVLVANAKQLGLTKFEAWREGGSEGRASFDRLTRFMTVVVGLGMGLRAAGRYLPYTIVQNQRVFVWQTAVQLTAGTATLIWLCDAVKAKGLSDGYSLVFGLNLAAGFMARIRRALPAVIAAGVPPRFYAQCVGAYVALSMAAVVLTRTELLLPLVHYRTQRAEAPARRRRSESSDGTRVQDTGLNGKALAALSYADTLPLRMCPGGMMSLIYASLVLAVLGGWAFDMSTLPVWGLGRHIAYCCALFVTVCVMEVCGQIMGDTPSGLAKSLVQLDAGIRGKAPGAETAAYIAALDSQLRVVGGCGMGLLAVAAHAFDAWCLTRVGVTAATSSMLLIASLVSGTITQVRALLQKPALQDLMRRETEALQLT